MTAQSSNVGKLKTLSVAPDTLVSTKHAFQIIRKKPIDSRNRTSLSDNTTPAADSAPTLNGEVLKLLGMFESWLWFLLLQSIKLLSPTKKKTSEDMEEDVDFKTNKQIYCQLLRATVNKNKSFGKNRPSHPLAGPACSGQRRSEAHTMAASISAVSASCPWGSVCPLTAPFN